MITARRGLVAPNDPRCFGQHVVLPVNWFVCEMIGLVPESGDPNVARSTNLEGHRVIITMGID